jgi:hypothetical protein
VPSFGVGGGRATGLLDRGARPSEGRFGRRWGASTDRFGFHNSQAWARGWFESF